MKITRRARSSRFPLPSALGAVAIAALLAPQFSAPAIAQDASKATQADGHRQLQAHAHGQGKLNIAVEGSRIEMELEAPAADIVGFEHAARTKQQRSAVAKARSTLAKPLALFRFPAAAGCRVMAAKVRLIAGQDGKHDHGHGHSHGSAKSSSKADDHARDAASHAEFHAEYKLACKSVASVSSIEVDYFKAFAGAAELQINVISPKGQTQYKVTRDKPRLELTGMM